MIYLDNAATTYPKPPEVIRAVAGVMEKIPGNPGRGGHAGALAGGRIVENCREQLCRLLGCGRPEQIIFCLNCTDALNIALKGTLHRGDEVIVSHAEHNAVMRPLMGLHDRGLIRVTLLPPDANGLLNPQTVSAAIGPKTALMVLCHASNVTGILQPAAGIIAACHEKGVPVLLDAAQTAGTEDLSRLPANMIAMPGHKGLLGPMGTGVLFLRQGMLPRPLREGGTGSASESMRQPAMLPDRLESGTLNLPGLAGLWRGVEYVLHNRAAIREYEGILAARLISGLRNIPGVTVLGEADAPRVGVVSFNIGRLDSGDGADRLNREAICVRGGLHCAPAIHAWLGTEGAVRASLGPYNTAEETDRFLDAVCRIAKES